jgi:iron complex transport system ATP-binding protein
MSQERLTIQALTWQPDKARPEILNSICTEFVQGGFYGILGPNGSGKTSLMRHILRLLETSHGVLELNDKNLSSYKRKDLARQIAFVPQNTNIDTSFTVYEIIMMGRAPHQKKFEATTMKDKEIVEQAMEMTNCSHLRDQVFSMLSGGEAQRVITARAITQQAPWLVLDEPISHLDIRYQIELMKHLQFLNQHKNTAILAVLHDINLACEYCKQIILMKDGEIIASGETKKIMTVENLKKVYDIEFVSLHHPNGKGNYFVPC